MSLTFSDAAWSDYLYWYKTDKRIVKRIHQLLEDIRRHPFEGIGKPEPLRHLLKGYWSRRIDSEHRLVYRVADNSILIAQLRYHYS